MAIKKLSLTDRSRTELVMYMAGCYATIPNSFAAFYEQHVGFIEEPVFAKRREDERVAKALATKDRFAGKTGQDRARGEVKRGNSSGECEGQNECGGWCRRAIKSLSKCTGSRAVPAEHVFSKRGSGNGGTGGGKNL